MRRYYVEVPFGAGTVKDTVVGISDDLFQVKGVTFMRISGRMFQRVTQAFQQHGWPYQVAAFADADEGDEPDALATVLMSLNPDIPGLVNPGR